MILPCLDQTIHNALASVDWSLVSTDAFTLALNESPDGNAASRGQRRRINVFGSASTAPETMQETIACADFIMRMAVLSYLQHQHLYGASEFPMVQPLTSGGGKRGASFADSGAGDSSEKVRDAQAFFDFYAEVST